MRAGTSSLQQTLTAEAASIVKQSVILAKRRGHAQVTPLHVANAMLSSSTGLLRTACMQSHSHPLQCKALELCFNVALNRLPATTTSTTNGPPNFHRHPPLSNALVAAFKRAQAHQRRGSIENQQQPVLAVKVEVEQLTISILDDPSVSRVMREAGFSSTQVKNNVEIAVSLDISSNSPPCKPKEPNLGLPILDSGIKSASSSSLGSAIDEDIANLVDNLLSTRRKCILIVGECPMTAESVVKELVTRIDKGEIPDPLKGCQFVSLPLFSLHHLCKEDVDQMLRKLRCVLNRHIARGALLYVGDLKWIIELRDDYFGDIRRKNFCPKEHIVFEIGRLVSDFMESGRFWLTGIASYQTFMRCRVGHPSLESLWGLHPLTVPTGSLGLSLNSESYLQGKSHDDGFEKQLTCCAECFSKFEMDVQRLDRTMQSSSTNSHLPLWLQQFKDEQKSPTSNNLDQFQIRELCKKWKGICNSIHKQHADSVNIMSFYCHSPLSSLKLRTRLTHSDQTSPNRSRKQHPLSISDKGALWEIPTSPNPALDRDAKFKQFDAESLKNLSSALETKATRQKDIIPEIASVVLQCRSGMMRRKGLKIRERKEDTWLFFEGGDTQSKKMIARELANQVFGSEKSFFSICFSSFSSVGADEDFKRKRFRVEPGLSYFEKLSEAIIQNPHRVIFLEDVDQVDYHTIVCIRMSIERGLVIGRDGDEIGLSDAIIILSCEGFISKSRSCSPCVKQKSGISSEEIEERSSVECVEKGESTSPCISLDLNLSVEDNEIEEQSCEVDLVNYVDRSFVLEIGRAENCVL